MTTFGRKRKLLLNMVENARDEVLSRHVGMTTTYTCTGSDWRELSRPQVSRPLESVVLPDEEVVPWLADDCKKFLTSGAWYRQRGIPHRYSIFGFREWKVGPFTLLYYKINRSLVPTLFLYLDS